MTRSAAFSTLFTLVLGSALAGQELRLREYGPADGLPAGHVFTILQDRTGYLWLGGARGLFQFDGHTFRAWKAGVPDGRVHAMQETPDGRLWIVASQGVAYRSPGAESFTRVDLPVAHNAKLTRAMAASADGRLLLGDGNTLWSLGWKGNALDIQSFAAPAGAAIRAVTVDSLGRVWAVCGPSLCRFDGGKLRPEPAQLPEEAWVALAAGPSGALAIRSEGSLWLRETAQGAFRRLEGGPGIVAAFYADVTFSPEGDLLTNTTRGLAIYRHGQWRSVGIENGLATRTLTALRFDREGIAWLGAASEPSLIRWDRRAPWSTWTRAQGLEEETVWGVTRDTAGGIWAAGSSGVFRKAPAEMFRAVGASPKEYFRQLRATPDGAVWALINRTKVRRMHNGTTQDFVLPARSLNYLLLDRERRLWAIGDHVFRTAGDVTAGPARFERLEPFATDANEDFQQASLDASGRVYMAGTNGLAIYDPARNTWERLATKDGLQHLRLLAVLADSSGSVWVSYRQPVPPTRLVFVNGHWQPDRVSLPTEFSSTLTVAFAEDPAKRIWAATEAGVFVWDRSQWRRFRRDDGLRSEDCVAGALMADGDGGIWVGTTRGLSYFDPQQPALSPVPPPAAALADLQIAGRDVSFGMRSLSYWREADQLYLYRLHGRRFFGTVFDTGWQETASPQVRYANLPGGSYRAEVKARNAEKLWSMRSFEQTFEVPVPWYATGWFGALVLGGLPALAYAVIGERRRRRAKSEAQLRRRLEDELALRSRQLAEAKQKAEASSQHKTDLLAAMTEQVRAPLHAFMGLAQLARTVRDETKRLEYLRGAEAVSTSLLTTLSDLLDYAELESGRLALHPEALDLHQCLAGVRRNGQSVPCELEAAVPRWVRTDRRRLHQILQSLVEPATGDVSIRVEAEPAGTGAAALTFTLRGAPPVAAFEPAQGGVPANRSALRGTVAARLVSLMGGLVAVVESPAGLAVRLTVAVLAGGRDEASRRVLVIAERAALRTQMAAMLEEAGFAVTATSAVPADAAAYSHIVVTEHLAWAVRGTGARVIQVGGTGGGAADGVVREPVQAGELTAALAGVEARSSSAG